MKPETMESLRAENEELRQSLAEFVMALELRATQMDVQQAVIDEQQSVIRSLRTAHDTLQAYACPSVARAKRQTETLH